MNHETIGKITKDLEAAMRVYRSAKEEERGATANRYKAEAAVTNLRKELDKALELFKKEVESEVRS